MSSVPSCRLLAKPDWTTSAVFVVLSTVPLTTKLGPAATPSVVPVVVPRAEQLPSVELNNTFYRVPAEEQLRRWAERTPAGFRFAVKMSRRITHFGRLGLIPTFCERVRLLGERLGPVLVQFPPTRTRDDGLLRLLRDSLDGEAPFRYLRLREPPYDDTALRGWANRLGPLLDEGIRVYAYFKHEDEPAAPHYARRLLELIAER